MKERDLKCADYVILIHIKSKVLPTLLDFIFNCADFSSPISFSFISSQDIEQQFHEISIFSQHRNDCIRYRYIGYINQYSLPRLLIEKDFHQVFIDKIILVLMDLVIYYMISLADLENLFLRYDTIHPSLRPIWKQLLLKMISKVKKNFR
jgi:hypothetical protein